MRFCLAAFSLLVIAGAFPAVAQVTDGPIKMRPEFALAMPLVQAGKHDVTVKFPVLINRTTVLRPGMVLRVLYIPPVPDDSVNLDAAHMGTMEQSYSRPGAASAGSGGSGGMPPEIAHEIERERRVVWEVPVHFQLALAQLPTDSLHLIYSQTGDDRNLDDERFNFFEGLFVGSPSAGVSVLGVEVGSKADKAGFKVGDQIVAVGGINVPPDLAAFPGVYAQARENAKEGRTKTFAFTVRSPGEARLRTLNVDMPPTIKSLLMEGF